MKCFKGFCGGKGSDLSCVTQCHHQEKTVPGGLTEGLGGWATALAGPPEANSEMRARGFARGSALGRGFQKFWWRRGTMRQGKGCGRRPHLLLSRSPADYRRRPCHGRSQVPAHHLPRATARVTNSSPLWVLAEPVLGPKRWEATRARGTWAVPAPGSEFPGQV